MNNGSFWKSKFDNVCLLFLIVFLVALLTWVDKHNNGDYEKWLEVFTAGIGGAFLSLVTAARQAWEKKEGNGGGPQPTSSTSPPPIENKPLG